MKRSGAFVVLTLALGLSPMIVPPVEAEGDVVTPGSTTRPDAAGRELAARLAIAEAGETVVIAAGEYLGNFVVRTPITLRGKGRPVLDGGGNGTVLTIAPEAAGTTVRGLALTGSGPGPLNTPSGLLVAADDVTVEDVEVSDSYMGIQVMGVHGAHVLDNTIESFVEGAVDGEMHATGDTGDHTGPGHTDSASNGGDMRGDAITLWNSTGTLIEGNTIRNTRDGIYLSFAVDATLRDNDVRNSRYAIHGMYASGLQVDSNHFEGNLAGAILMYGGPFDLSGNTILHSRSPSTGIGILLKDGSAASMSDNVIVANRVGIKLDNGGAGSSASAPATVRFNTIGMNQVGVEVTGASRGSFSHNSFVENIMHVTTDGDTPNIEWSLAGFGNHWSSYTGYDTAGDGVGDIPFVQGGSIARTLVRSPVMMALASGPAFRLLQAVEDRWAPEDPVVEDRLPLMEIQSPAMNRGRNPEPAPGWFGVAGGIIAILAWLVLWRTRSARKRPAGTRVPGVKVRHV